MLAVAQNSELDCGATSVAPGTERTCALTRELKPASEMIRFVLGPAGEVVPDVKRKLPGTRHLDHGIPRGDRRRHQTQRFCPRFQTGRAGCRGSRRARTDQLIERAAIDALAIAGKAGTVISGFTRVEAAVGRDDILALIHAADAGDEGKRKLDAALRRQTTGKSSEIVVIDVFTGAQLDLALNRPNVVHAALLAGPGSETFLTRVARLRYFRAGISPEAVSAHAPTGGA